MLEWADFRGWDIDATALLWRVVRYLDSQRAERLENERSIAEARKKR